MTGLDTFSSCTTSPCAHASTSHRVFAQTRNRPGTKVKWRHALYGGLGSDGRRRSPAAAKNDWEEWTTGQDRPSLNVESATQDSVLKGGWRPAAVSVQTVDGTTFRDQSVDLSTAPSGDPAELVPVLQHRRLRPALSRPPGRATSLPMVTAGKR
jgi:hypothetical protein